MIARRALPSFRLIDGVIIATVALLGLKVLGLFADAPAPAALPPAPAVQVSAAPARQAGFGKVFSHARTNYDPAEPTTTGSLAKADEPAPVKEEPPAPRPAAPPLTPPSASERLLLDRLGERREELQQRSREMEARERMLQEQERKLDERQGQLKASEDTQKAAATMPKSSADPSALKNVVIMYETMKPKEAARVFDRLPIEVLLSVVTQMNSRKMAEVLAAMTPENAEKLTVALARRANAPEEIRALPVSALPYGELPAIERPGGPRR